MSRDIRALVALHLKDLLAGGDVIVLTEEWSDKHGWRRVKGLETCELSRRERAEWKRILRGLLKEVAR